MTLARMKSRLFYDEDELIDPSIANWDSYRGKPVTANAPSTKPPSALAHIFNDLWSWGDHLEARRGGWLLDNGSRRNGVTTTGVWEIRRSIHNNTFDTDEQAQMFVEMLMENGDPLALKAYRRMMVGRLTG